MLARAAAMVRVRRVTAGVGLLGHDSGCRAVTVTVTATPAAAAVTVPVTVTVTVSDGHAVTAQRRRCHGARATGSDRRGPSRRYGVTGSDSETFSAAREHDR
jgi:hypothetical protein